MLFKKKDYETEYYEGIKTVLIFPKKETRAHNITSLGTGGTIHKKHNIKRKSIFRVAEKGLVFEKGNEDGSDYRIPWEEIIEIKPVTKSLKVTLNQMTISLNDGRELKFILKPKMHDSLLSLCEPKIINNKKDDGW